jgi:hypothetical protein
LAGDGVEVTNNSPEPGSDCEVLHLLENAAKSRRLAREVLDKQTIDALTGFAVDCCRQAAAVIEAHPDHYYCLEKRSG